MKFLSATAFVLAALTGEILAAPSSDLVSRAPQSRIAVTFSEKTVNAGSVDLFNNVWQAFFHAKSNLEAITEHRDQDVWTTTCNSPYDHQSTKTTITIEGKWGELPGMNKYQVRQALIEAAYDVLLLYAKQADKRYTINTGCAGMGTIANAHLPHPVCGGVGQPGCECHPNGGVQCAGKIDGLHLPVSLTANTWTGELSQVPTLKLTISSVGPGADGGGCPKELQQGKAVLGLIPGVGPFMAAGIDFLCA